MKIDQLAKGIKLQDGIEQANQLLQSLETVMVIEFGFRSPKNMYQDPKRNPVFQGFLYKDLKDVVISYCKEELKMLIKNWNKELEEL